MVKSGNIVAFTLLVSRMSVWLVATIFKLTQKVASEAGVYPRQLSVCLSVC